MKCQKIGCNLDVDETIGFYIEGEIKYFCKKHRRYKRKK